MKHPTPTNPLPHGSADQALAVLQLVHYLEQSLWERHGEALGHALAVALRRPSTALGTASPTLDQDFDLPF